MKIRRRPPNPSVAVSSLRYQIDLPDAKPSHILEEIVWYKEDEVERTRQRLPLSELQRRVLMAEPSRDFLAALRHGRTQPALIAEVKKASPSKGVIREDFDPVAIAQSYVEGGSTCLSVLTDEKFFQGSFDYLAQVRQAVDIPLLCKEFIIYPYQMYMARVYGADAVLLIAAVLSDKDLSYFVKIANGLGMTPLVEVHNAAEMERVLRIDQVQLIGINNRDLTDFSVDLSTTSQLIQSFQETIQQRDICIVSESGLHTADDIAMVQQAGAKAVLIGESLMRYPDPAVGIRQLFRHDA